MTSKYAQTRISLTCFAKKCVAVPDPKAIKTARTDVVWKVLFYLNANVMILTQTASPVIARTY